MTAKPKVEAFLGRHKQYPEYKDSGLEWLESVPAHWQVQRLKYLATLNPASLAEDTSPAFEMVYVDIGGVDDRGRIVEREPMVFSSAPSRARRLVADGDVIVSTVRTYLRAIAPIKSPESNLVVSTGFAVVRPSSALVGDYAAYALRSPYFVERVVANSKGVSFPAINESEMATYGLAVPPVSEQAAIAAFLDRETTRIDALVAKKERLIELLNERRNALIESVVSSHKTDSSTPLGYHVDLLSGYAFSSEAFSENVDDIRLLRGVNIAPGAIRWDDVVCWSRADVSKFSRYQLREGDLVFGMDRPWIGDGIRVAEVSVNDLPCLLLQRVARLRAKPALIQRYLRLLLSSPQFRAYFEPMLTGISVPHVSPAQIRGFRVTLPSIPTQQDICARLAIEMREIDAMRMELEASILRVLELRVALISAAVTGKIDVRDTVAAN